MYMLIKHHIKPYSKAIPLLGRRPGFTVHGSSGATGQWTGDRPGSCVSEGKGETDSFKAHLAMDQYL